MHARILIHITWHVPRCHPTSCGPWATCPHHLGGGAGAGALGRATFIPRAVRSCVLLIFCQAI